MFWQFGQKCEMWWVRFVFKWIWEDRFEEKSTQQKIATGHSAKTKIASTYSDHSRCTSFDRKWVTTDSLGSATSPIQRSNIFLKWMPTIHPKKLKITHPWSHLYTSLIATHSCLLCRYLETICSLVIYIWTLQLWNYTNIRIFFFSDLLLSVQYCVCGTDHWDAHKWFLYSLVYSIPLYKYTSFIW